MAKKAKAEEKPHVKIPETRDEAELLLSKLGTVRRRVDAIESVRDAEVAESYARYHAQIEEAKREEEEMYTALAIWAEHNRDDLTQHGKTKSARLSTGVVSWRKSPDAVVVTDEKAVIDQILEHRPELKDDFVKIATSLDKQRMLTLRDKAVTLVGVTVKVGAEKFEAKPNPIVPKGD